MLKKLAGPTAFAFALIAPATAATSSPIRTDHPTCTFNPHLPVNDSKQT